jgi:hypothetical protein
MGFDAERRLHLRSTIYQPREREMRRKSKTLDFGYNSRYRPARISARLALPSGLDKAEVNLDKLKAKFQTLKASL